MSQDKVISHIDERGVATITLNQPDKHNAFDDHVIARLTEAFTEVSNNDDVRVVVLAATGKSFSAGADLSWMKRMAQYDYEHNLQDARLLADMLKALATLPHPTIAAVQGAAFGGAVGLVSCCDMAVASEHALFALSEVRIGLVPATIGPYVLAAIGQRATQRYFLTGERFDASTAQHLGLVTTVVAPDELDDAVNTEVNSILKCGPHAVRQAKDLINHIVNRPIDDDMIEQTCSRIASIRVSPEGQEGLGAFLEKRQPAWLKP